MFIGSDTLASLSPCHTAAPRAIDLLSPYDELDTRQRMRHSLLWNRAVRDRRARAGAAHARAQQAQGVDARTGPSEKRELCQPPRGSPQIRGVGSTRGPEVGSTSGEAGGGEAAAAGSHICRRQASGGVVGNGIDNLYGLRDGGVGGEHNGARQVALQVIVA